jgi:hypothetical protein
MKMAMPGDVPPAFASSLFADPFNLEREGVGYGVVELPPLQDAGDQL